MLKKLQAGSGVTFAIFVFVHLVNTWAATLGPQVYDGLQRLLQSVYQSTPIEALLLAALAVHVVIGVMRIVMEDKRVLSTRARWHRYAGFFLAVVIVGHVLAVRGPSWFYDVYPGFAGLSFSMHFLPMYFYPYYFLLGMAGFYHALHGLSVALPRLGVGMRVTRRSLVISTAVAAGLMLSALLSFHGVWRDVGDPYQSEFAKLGTQLFGLTYE